MYLKEAYMDNKTQTNTEKATCLVFYEGLPGLKTN